MARKTFIKIRRGILEPKHRIKLGAAWQLYFYMLDLVNWETGMIFGWKDKDAACDLEMPIATLRDQRRRLEDELYISTTIKKYGLEIKINKWKNPRQGEEDLTPWNGESDEPLTPSIESDTESDTESDETLTPLHLIKRTEYTLTDVQQESCQENQFSKIQRILGILLFQNDVEYFKELLANYGEEKVMNIAQWLKKKDPNIKNMRTALRAIDSAAKSWKEQPEKEMTALEWLESELAKSEEVTNG